MPVTEEDKQKADKAYKAFRKDPTAGEAVLGGLGEAAKMVVAAPYHAQQAVTKYIAEPIAKDVIVPAAKNAGTYVKNYTGLSETPIYDPRVAAIVGPSAQAFAGASPETEKIAQTSYPTYYKAGSVPLASAKPEELIDVSKSPTAQSAQTMMPTQMGTGGGAPAKPQEISRLGPTVNAAYQQAFASEQSAAEKNIQDIKREYDDAKQFWQTQATDQLAQNDAQKAAEAERIQMQEKQRQDFEHTANAVSNMRIDPDRFWNNKTTDEKVMANIGLALGAFAAGFKGGRNHALDMLNSQIDRDIDAQKKNWEISASGADAKKSAFSMAMQQTGDARAAEAIARAGIADAVKYKVEAMAAKAKGTEAQNNARTLMAALDMQKAKFLDQATVFGVLGGGGGGGLGKKLELDEEKYVHMGTDQNGNEIGTYAADSHEARLARAKQAAAKIIDSQYTQALQLRDQISKTNNPYEKWAAYQQLKTLQSSSIANTNTFQGQGVINAGDQVRSVEAMGKWTDNLFVNKNVGNRLIEQSRQNINKSLQQEIASHAGKLVHVVKQEDPNTGNVKRYGIQTGTRFDPGMMPNQNANVQKPITSAPVNPTAKR